MIPMRAWIGGIELSGSCSSAEGLIIANKGIDGWYDTPGVKTDVEERVGADGAFPVQGRDLEYSARTVTLHGAYVKGSREHAVETYNRFNALTHQIVEMRVLDVDDTMITGWIETAFGSKWAEYGEFAVTVNTSDPRRYESEAQRLTLVGAGSTGAFEYVVEYPIRYGSASAASQSGTVVNRGTASSWPVITVHGDIPGGFTLMDSLGRSITYAADVMMSAPVTIDCGRRVALVQGVNRSRDLTVREWFDVPKGSDLTISFMPTQVGDSWADVEFRSAWI